MVLTDPANGMITCTLGGDGVPSTGDTCTIMCIGVVMTDGSRTRTCGSDGNWSSTTLECGSGNIINVPLLLIR